MLGLEGCLRSANPFGFISQMWPLRPRHTKLPPHVTQPVSSNIRPRSHISSHIIDFHLQPDLKLEVQAPKGFAAHFPFCPVVGSLWPVIAAVWGRKCFEQKMHSWSRRGEGANHHQSQVKKSPFYTDGLEWFQGRVNSRRWRRTGKPGVLQSMGSQRVRHDLAADQQGI